jgi:6-phosphogluconolactonase
MNRDIQILNSQSELVNAAAERIVEIIVAATTEHGRCTLALAGGGTPRDVYALLATENYRSRVDWSKVYLFWGDERTVPPDHPDSNFRMANESLISHIAIPPGNIFRMCGEIEPVVAATEYEKLLKLYFGDPIPQFDLILLGLGEDGHTASLFPGTTAVDERLRPVVSVFVPKLNTHRITLTLPVINNALHVMFIVAGKSKAEIALKVIKSEKPTKELPATLVQPERGQLDWMLDAAAALL